LKIVNHNCSLKKKWNNFRNSTPRICAHMQGDARVCAMDRTLRRNDVIVSGLSIRIRSRDGTCRFWLPVTFARILWTFNGAGVRSLGSFLSALPLRIIPIKIQRSAPVQFVRRALSITIGLTLRSIFLVVTTEQSRSSYVDRHATR